MGNDARRVAISIPTNTYGRRRLMVSMWKKSVANSPAAYARRQVGRLAVTSRLSERRSRTSGVQACSRSCVTATEPQLTSWRQFWRGTGARTATPPAERPRIWPRPYLICRDSPNISASRVRPMPGPGTNAEPAYEVHSGVRHRVHSDIDIRGLSEPHSGRAPASTNHRLHTAMFTDPATSGFSRCECGWTCSSEQATEGRHSFLALRRVV